MKKQRRKTSKKRSRTTAAAPASPERRGALLTLRNGAVAAIGLSIGGVFMVRSVQATVAEHDLTRIGNGRASIVQIHDPQCPMCRALQRETRAAYRAVGSDDLQYLVADIRTAEGSALAARHGVGHVTLVLFDRSGEAREILPGHRERDELQTAFEAHLRRR
ncbi:MAG: hypothetical protein AAGA32_11425 [Pseudomonadota bacterium]